MKQDFSDITLFLGEPKWYDFLGYPRYEAFQPSRIAVLNMELVILSGIICPHCLKVFLVATCYHSTDIYKGNSFSYNKSVNVTTIQSKYDNKSSFGLTTRKDYFNMWLEVLPKLTDQEMRDFIFYGSPPHHGKCPGNLIESKTLAIMECWLDGEFQWTRLRHIEGTLLTQE